MVEKTENSTNTPIIIDPAMLQRYYPNDDEISLVDLWLILVKQKHIIILTMLVVMMMAGAYITLVPDIYHYKTNITIGTYPFAQSKVQLIQSPEEVVSNLDNAIIPKILRQQFFDQSNKPLDISASIPKKTHSVLLTSKGRVEQKDAIIKLHQQLIAILAEMHQKKVRALWDYLHDELKSSQAMLVQLNKKLETLGDQNESLTLQIINLENTIHQLKRDIAEFTPTRSVMGTVQSLKPINKKSNLVLVVSVVLGLFLGVLLAFFANFIAEAKTHMNDSQ